MLQGHSTHRRQFGMLAIVTGLTLVGASRQVQAGPSDVRKYLASYQRPKDIPYPKDNPYSKAKQNLGQTLFFDPRLSGSNWISCATCHNPALSWGDGLAKGIGHGMKELARRTPTILNLAWGELMFWDGRASSLEEQALGPIQSEGEMNLPHEQMIAKLQALPGYKPMFDKAFSSEGISKETVAKAIATYERSVVSGTAPFDLWVAGDEKALSEPAKRGFLVFHAKAQCAQCHSGWRFTDDSFYDIGLPGDDIGRAKHLPGIEPMQHAFKTPTLRNVELRGPYMHDGSEKTLAEVIDFYNLGSKTKRPSVSEHIKPLNLSSAEKADLLAFLLTLTSTDKPVEIPVLPR